MRTLILTLFIWTICFAAIVAGCVLTYDWYHNRGPIIHITFQDADGLVPTQSKVFYKGVVVGDILDIKIDPKELNAVVEVRISRYFKNLVGEKSKFWLVKPEFGLGKISNLSAIATGNYIEVLPAEGKFHDKFIGLKETPIDPDFEKGLQINLHTCELGGINMDSPILYRGLQIGEIRDIHLAKSRREVIINAYIYRDYMNVVRNGSFFSDISGFHADISLFSGSEISMDSVRTLLIGGIELHTPNLQAPQAKPGQSFRVLTPEQEKKLRNS